MSEEPQFEFEQAMSRADVAADLRRVADTLRAAPGSLTIE
jgi:hypothetical protein